MAFSEFFKKLMFAREINFGEDMELFGIRWYILPLKYLAGLNHELIKNVKGAKKLIYDEGHFVGELAVGQLVHKYGMTGMKAVENGLEITKFAGFGGSWKIPELDDKGNSIMHVASNYAKEYRERYGKQRGCIDYHWAGVLAGGYKTIYNIDVICYETMCVAKGDPYCEFIIRSKKNKDAKKKWLKWIKQKNS